MSELTTKGETHEGESQSLISYLLNSNGLSTTEATFVLADLMGAAVDTVSSYGNTTPNRGNSLFI